MNCKRLMVSLLVACCAAVLAAACGSSSNSNGTSSAGSSGSTGSTPSSNSAGGSFKVLLDTPTENPILAFPDVQQAAQSAANAINKAGGVNGQKIQIVYCNNQGDPNHAEDCAREAVQDHVAAVVGHIDIWSNDTFPILQQAGIPDVGFWSNGLPVDWTSSVSYPLQTGSVGSYVALDAAAHSLGKKRLAVATTNIPAAINNGKTMQNVAPKAGLQYAGTVVIPDTGVTDYSSYAQKLKSMNPDAVALVLSVAPVNGLLKAAANIGFHPQWLFIGQAFGEKEAAQLGSISNGMVITNPYPGVRTTKSPMIAQFDSEMKSVGVDPITEGKNVTQSWAVQMNAWLSVWAVAKAAATVKGSITAASLKSALDSAGTLSLPGGFKWSPNAKGPNGYTRFGNFNEYFLRVNNGKITTLSLKPTDVANLVPPAPTK